MLYPILYNILNIILQYDIEILQYDLEIRLNLYPLKYPPIAIG